MRILFVHQNMPGQFGRLATHLARSPQNEVIFVTRRNDVDLEGVLRASYALKLPARDDSLQLGRKLAEQALYGEAVVRACQALAARGFKPDVIVGHPGWGELLFLKDLYPDVPLINYCEYYWRPDVVHVEGDPPRPLGLEQRLDRRAQSAHLLLSLEAADRGWSPTAWQRSLFPRVLQDKIEVIFDGVDTGRLRPDPEAQFELPDGRRLRPGDQVVTFAARSLEPTRGFPQFMRAIPEILKRSPTATIVIAGDERPHYDRPPQAGGSWKTKLLGEAQLPTDRVLFLGRLPYDLYVSLLQVSAAHVYLTTPTVLSWSFFEAMSAGCLMVASATSPAKEVLIDGENGFLFPFDSPDALASTVVGAIRSAEGAEIRRLARATIVKSYSLELCVPMASGMIDRVLRHPGNSRRG